MEREEYGYALFHHNSDSYNAFGSDEEHCFIYLDGTKHVFEQEALSDISNLSFYNVGYGMYYDRLAVLQILFCDNSTAITEIRETENTKVLIRTCPPI